MKPTDVIKKLEKKRTAILDAAVSVMREYGAKGVEEAKRLSSGTLSSVALRRLGHPYGRRSALAPVNAQIINRQSGAFLNAWKFRIVGFGGQSGKLKGQIINDSPHAGFLDTGTRLMIQRPIREAIIRKLTRPYRRAMANAVRRALKK